MVGGQDLVAGFQRQRASDHVQPGGGVGDVDKIVCIGADEGAQRGAGLGHQALEAAAEELDRLAFELALPALVGLEDGARAGAERPVVEENHVRAEEEEIAEFRAGV